MDFNSCLFNYRIIFGVIIVRALYLMALFATIIAHYSRVCRLYYDSTVLGIFLSSWWFYCVGDLLILMVVPLCRGIYCSSWRFYCVRGSIAPRGGSTVSGDWLLPVLFAVVLLLCSGIDCFLVVFAVVLGMCLRIG